MRRIKSARITFISLVPRGANQLPVLYKSADQTVQFDCLVKDERFAEHGELTAVVYAPETMDSQGDVASAEVIKQMAHDYMRNVGSVDLRHDTTALPREKVAVVENFIIQEGDPRFANQKDTKGRPVNVTGGWGVVIKVDDPDLRRLYREGHWNGVSMFGPATVEPISKNAGSIADELAKRLSAGNHNDKEDDMDIKELEAALSKSNDSLVDRLVAGLAKALKPDAKADDKGGDANKPTIAKIEFEGDPTNVEDIAKHEAKLVAARVDWNDPKSVAAYRTSVAKAQADAAAKAGAGAGGDGKGNEGKSPELVKAEAELAKAQAELAKAQRASNQGTDDKGGNAPVATGLSKEVTAGFSTGSRMAKFANGG